MRYLLLFLLAIPTFAADVTGPVFNPRGVYPNIGYSVITNAASSNAVSLTGTNWLVEGCGTATFTGTYVQASATTWTNTLRSDRIFQITPAITNLLGSANKVYYYWTNTLAYTNWVALIGDLPVPTVTNELLYTTNVVNYNTYTTNRIGNITLQNVVSNGNVLVGFPAIVLQGNASIRFEESGWTTNDLYLSYGELGLLGDVNFIVDGTNSATLFIGPLQGTADVARVVLVSSNGLGNVSSDVTFDASYTWQTASLTDATTILPPTNAVAGTRLELWLTASGDNRNLSFDASIVVPSDSTFTSPKALTSGKTYIVVLRYSGSVWWLQSLVGGF